MAKIDRMLGGACTYIALAASYFNPVKIVAVVGEISIRRMRVFWRAVGSICRAWSGYRVAKLSSGKVSTRRI